MKAIIFATLATAALGAYAGEDSTYRSGPGGTGPAFWEVPCGLRGFSGPGEEKPCTSPAPAADASSDETRAWMEQHKKAMDEMMSRMNAEHRAMMGGTAGRGADAAGAAAR